MILNNRFKVCFLSIRPMREEFEEKGINPHKEPHLKNMMSQMTNPFPTNMNTTTGIF